MKRLWLVMALVLAIFGSFTMACGESCDHEGEHVYVSVSNEQHQLQCAQCEAVLNTGYHYGGCLSPNECDCCGAEGVTLANITCESDREHDWVWVFDNVDHRYQCRYCDNGYEWEFHYAHCDTPTACEVCGATGVTIDLYHDYDSEYVNLGEQHQLQCLGCGMGLYEPSNHRVQCDEPNKCMDCGATDVTSGDVRHGSKGHVSIGNQHQMQCLECGAPQGEAKPHQMYCHTPNVCYWCKATDVTTGILIHEDSEYVDLGEQHQKQCVRCGAGESEPEYHEGSCAAPDECDTCNLTGVTIKKENLWHHRNNWDWVNLGEQHQYQCRVCGETKGNPQDHSGYCETPTQCSVCGAAGVTLKEEELNHWHNERVYVDLGTKHQGQCLGCGAKFEPNWHEVSCNSPTKCNVCGLTGVTAEYIYHEENELTYINLGEQHQMICLRCGGEDSAPNDHEGPCYLPTWCNICRFADVFVKPENMYHDFNNGICEDCGKRENEPTRLPGDANESSGVTIADALTIFEYKALNETTSINTSNADVTGDGEVDAQDALRILQHEAGWNVTLK